MSRSGAARLALPLFALLVLPLLSCDRGNYPGAPEGSNFRTAHIVWKLTGNTRGTMEEFLETSAFKEGRLHYKRRAHFSQYDQDMVGQSPVPRKIDVWVINDQGVQYNVIKPMRQVFKYKINLDQLMGMSRTMMWRELLWGLMPRKDLTQTQRQTVKANIADPKDEYLKQIGAKITSDTFLGHKVKRYEIPLQGGRAILLLYGDIPLMRDLKYTRFGEPFQKIMTATTFELNKSIPEAAITPPKEYKIVDSTRKIREK